MFRINLLFLWFFRSLLCFLWLQPKIWYAPTPVKPTRNDSGASKGLGSPSIALTSLFSPSTRAAGEDDGHVNGRWSANSTFLKFPPSFAFCRRISFKRHAASFVICCYFSL